MKLLNITVSGTIHHVIDFDDPKRYAKTFIAQNVTEEPVLFSLQTMDGGDYYYTQTQSGQRPLMLVAIRETNEDTNTDQYISQTKHIFFLEQNFDANQLDEESQQAITDAINNYKARFNETEQNLKLYFNAQREFYGEMGDARVAKFTIKFTIATLTRKGKITEKEGSFVLVFAAQENIYQGTVDFGSEASQVMVYNCGGETYDTSNIMQVFQDLGITLGKRNEIQAGDNEHAMNRQFIQFDPDMRLFRSHFFARKTFTGEEQFSPAGNPKDNRHLVLMNTYDDLTKEFKENFFTLPNVKIAALSDYGPEVECGERITPAMTFQNRYFYRATINAFIYQVLKNIAGERQAENPPAFLRLTILMPNVYTQAEHSQKMKHLHEDIQAMLNAEFSTVIGGVEINSISESDASFLGYFTANPQFALTAPHGYYLIIDAGKGTMDLSVLKVDPQATEQPYTPEYRTGIVGSGNAITYAVFLDMMAERLSAMGVPTARLETTIDAIVRQLILGGDEATLAEMMRLVERFKQCWGKQDWQETPNPENNDERNFAITQQENQVIITLQNNNTTLRLGDILEWVKSYFDNTTLSDVGSARLKEDVHPAMNYTRAMIQKLVNDMLVKFTYTRKIDRIVLSGRAFLLPQLKQAILKGLRQKDNCKEAKEIGLNQEGFNLKNLCLFAGQQLASQKYDGRVVGRPEYKKYGEDPYLYVIQGKDLQTKQKVSDWVKKVAQTARRKFKRLGVFGDTHPTAIMSAKDYKDGIRVIVENRHADKIAINGIYYDIPNIGTSGQKKTEGYMYFNGDHFIFVCNDGAYPFSPAAQATASNIFESTFPYGATGTGIPFPRPAQVDAPPTPPQSDIPEEREDDTEFEDNYAEPIETEEARWDNDETSNTNDPIDRL